MPRVRSLKPDFFTDAELAERQPLHRIAFEGLWCHADRDGRLEDKPRELRVKILPYDQCDFDAILDDLARPKADGREGFIRRYAVNGKRYIAITHFGDHQNPHPNEKSAEIPPPPPWEPAEAVSTHGAFEKLPERSGGNGSLVVGAGLWNGSLDSGPPPPRTAVQTELALPPEKLAAVVGEQVMTTDVSDIPVMRTCAVVRWKPTEDGCFEMIQLERELRGLERESERPPRFQAWWTEAMARAGPDGVQEFVRGYLYDPSIRTPGHPTALLIGKIWKARKPQSRPESRASP